MLWLIANPARTAALGTGIVAVLAVAGVVWLRADARHEAEAQCVDEKRLLVLAREKADLAAANAALANDNRAREAEVAARDEAARTSRQKIESIEAKNAELLDELTKRPDASDPIWRADDPLLRSRRMRERGATATGASGGGGR